MNTPRVCIVSLALCACAAIVQPAGAQSLADGHREQAKFLLGQLEQQIGKIQNFRCQRITPVAPVPLTSDADITRYRHEWLASDRQGRGRVRISEEGRISTQIWNGEKTVSHLAQVDSNGTVTHQVSVATGIHYQIQRHQEPWDYLGRDVVHLLTTALASEWSVRVSETNADRHRLDLRDDSGAVHTIILDPQQGYAPIYRRVYADSKVQSLETVTFEEVQSDIWFPVEVRTEVGPQETRLPASVLKCRFSNVTLDNWQFEKSLELGFAEGTEIYDGVTGQTYIVDANTIDSLTSPDPAPTADANAPAVAPTPASQPVAPAWRTAFDATYQLDEGEVLKCIAPPFIPQRHQYLLTIEPNLIGQTDRVIANQIYRFEWDDGLVSKEQVAPRRFLELSSVIENVVGLGSYEYEGLAHLLNLPVTGDWIVREGAPTEQLLVNLEHIVQEQRQWSIGFVKQQVDAIVIRASGNYRFRTLPERPAEDSVHVYTGSIANLSADVQQGNACGTVARFLEDVAHRVGMRIVDDTQSSQLELRWVSHSSAQLRQRRNSPSLYNTQLASLLNNLTAQTGLSFQIELGKVEQWKVAPQQSVATRSN
jgi:hypothetical protein